MPSNPSFRLDHNFIDKQTRYKFIYDNTWDCNLTGVQCEHKVVDQHSGNERRCKRTSTTTLPYCPQHLIKNYNLQVKRTTLVDAHGDRFNFRGLFACDKTKGDEIIFKKGDRIVSYIGDVIDAAELNDRYPGDETAPYGMQSNNKVRSIDAACRRGVGALANMCRTGQGCSNNATVSVSANHYPHLKATKNIRNGDEIFLSYGKSYWSAKSIHKNYKTTPNYYNQINHKC